ncbi:iron(III) transport system substrate-binding protein [Alkalispirillum mobile]|uniref:Iron(III) transport system substrate-binding protein n=1 Tax=Alkalispirillum mobile TaxID=85925 RepID=A0A498BZ29_9GAMM|nr:Fe(3+) ABC transporter substrate-binding protein [Alkalispirillum mobile]RLK48173.1 iron(III) transport system substrate-binding protein [Alkalispirillum mobile]
MKLKRLLTGLLAAPLALPLAATLAVPGTAQASDDTVTVYSARQEHLIKPLFDRFTEETGINVRYVTDSAGPLLARLQQEGRRTPADVLMTVDAGNLWQAADRGVLQSIDSEPLRESIPEHLRDPDDQWFGLSVRARTIMYAPDRVDPEELSTYEDLADPKWEGRLCVRTSQHVYNQSLVATMISHHGEERTREVLEGWVNNFADRPFSNDTSTLRAIAAGQCDVSITNTYYLGRVLKDDPDFPVAPFWPNQDDVGVHVNVSGAGVTRHANNPEQAQKLIEWLASDAAQEDFAALNMEYPANPDIALDPIVAEWGDFEADNINVSEAGRLQRQAAMLMDRVGWR